MEKVFITGGAGFIGRWLVAHCLKQGLEVVVYDNLSTGSLDNIKPFLENIVFFQGDILEHERLKEAMEKTKPDAVFHLAAHHFIPFCNDHPLDTIRVNVEGTFSVLSAAAKTKSVSTVVVASSGAIYPSLKEPLHEDIKPEPMDIYGLSKVLCEEITKFFSITTHLRCIVARLFNTYGPFERTPHLIPEIINNLRKGHRIELGNLHTKRDYIYVEDSAEALFKTLDIEAKYEVVNIGTGFEYSALEIVQILSELIGTKIEVVSNPTRQRLVDKLHQIADTKKMYHITGWRAKYSIQEGLKRYLQNEGLLPNY